jgi:magnesium transporter
LTYFTKQYHPPGTPPGTLKEISEKGQFNIRLVDYSASEYTSKDLATAEECRAFLEKDTTTWIHIQGQPSTDTLEYLGVSFDLHPLALEDVHNTVQRPKVDSYDDTLFVILSLPTSTDSRISIEQVSLFVGAGYLISFHNGARDPFSSVRKRLENHMGKLRDRGADYLLYALTDTIIDEGFPVLEYFGELIEDLEEELLEVPEKETLKKIHDIKRELLLLRRMLWPQREVLNLLMRHEYSLLKDETIIYMRDCYDHTVQIMDLIETYRDMTTSMLDVYLSSISYRLNDVMRVLTVIATIFIPLTFLVGVYGMNFGINDKSPWAMPELDWYYAYPILWIVMILVAVGMILFFRRRGWF